MLYSYYMVWPLTEPQSNSMQNHRMLSDKRLYQAAKEPVMENKGIVSNSIAEVT